MIGEITNHLWQSTVFAVVVVLLASAFRKNRAEVRYWLWLSASLKFLVPFSLLISLGLRLWDALPAGKTATPIAAPGFSQTMVEITQPFPETLAYVSSAHHATRWIPIAVFSLWAFGFFCVALMRCRSWFRIRAAVRASVPLNVKATIPVRSSATLLEPGVVGFLRPVLLLPEGIVKQLTPPQLEAVLAHEQCHVRRRDNLTSAFHMLVEAIFWFHPAIWWIGARLVEERERACDEAVLNLGSEPQVYAEGILNVCKSYLESPLRCVPGVTGSDLKKRIRAILTERVAGDLNFTKKLALTVVGIAALTAPILVGMFGAAAIRAQSASASTPQFEVATIKLCKDFVGEGGRGGGGNENGGSSPDRLDMPCQPVRNLIRIAYIRANFRATGGNNLQLEGGPAWIDSERYQISAKAEGPATLAVMEGPLLQKLLEDRFQLKTHREIRESKIYALTVASGGLKMKPAEPGSCTPRDLTQDPPPQAAPRHKPYCGDLTITMGRRRIILDLASGTMAQLVQNIGVGLDRPGVDITGITEKFDFHLEFAPEEADPSNELTAPSIFSVLGQLGLKLVPAKGPREFLVIDSVQRASPN